MTAICGGGASEPRPEFAPVVFVGPAIIGALLNNIPTPWAVGLAYYVGLLTYDLAAYCTVDPPADPGLTAADALALLTLNPVAAPIAEARFRQFIGRYLWYDLCRCVSVATPAPPAAPAQPVGWPDINPTALPQPLVAACKTYDSPVLTISGVQSFNRGGFNWVGRNLTSIQIKTTTVANVAPGTSVQFVVKQFDTFNSGTVLRTDSFTTPATFSLTRTLPVDPGSNEFALSIVAQGGTGSTDVSWHADGFCEGVPPGGQAVGCCPPDPQLLHALNSIMETVTLMQRQLAPFAYVPGAAHAGLVGNGAFAIQGLLGVKVQLTTVPAWSGHIAGSPDELFDVGFVTFGVDDGYPHSVRIEHSPQVMLPARASVFTSLGYTLPPGVVATITELKREP